MASPKFYAVSGIIKKASDGEVPKGGFDLLRLLEWHLDNIHVPFYDECCPDASEGGSLVFPVRFDSESGELQRFDGTNWVVVDSLASGSTLASFVPTGAQTNITAGTGGAIPLTSYVTTINTDAGGDAFTLADGTQIGQVKKIRLVVDGGGDGVVTPTNLAGGTTLTFNDAGDFVELIWDGTEWVVIDNSGVTHA